MPYEAAAARRMLAGHLENIYAERVTHDAFDRDVEALAVFAGDNDDPELEAMARELVRSLRDPSTAAPVLALPELGITIAPPEVTPTARAEAEAAARRAVAAEAATEPDPGAEGAEAGTGSATEPAPTDPASGSAPTEPTEQ